MSLSFFKSKLNYEKRRKISAVEIIKYGSITEKRYNSILSTSNYEIARNVNLYVPSRPNVEIIGVDILAGYVILKIDTIFKSVVISVEDENNIYVKSPENFTKNCKEGKVILAAISDILLNYYNSCLKFKSFKTDVTKVKDINGDFELEINPNGIFLCIEKRKDFKKFCSVMYDHYILSSNTIFSVTDEEFNFLKSLCFFVEDCPEWLKKEYLRGKKYKKSKKEILKVLENYFGGLK